MFIVKSIVFGFLSLIAGNLIGFILFLVVGAPVELVAEKILSAPTLYGETSKRFRYISDYAFTGFTIGAIHASLIFFFKVNGAILLLIFIIYLFFFMGRNNRMEFVLDIACNNDIKKFKRLLIISETITFISYMSGIYVLWNIFMKWG